MALGALGLLGQLAAVARAPGASALAKKIEKMSAEQRAALVAAFPELAAPVAKPSVQLRKVASAFVAGEEASSGEFVSTGTQLKLGSKVIGSRATGSTGDRFVTVCPYKFEEKDPGERRAANALFEALAAGVKVGDRKGASFYNPVHRKGQKAHPGRLAVETQCTRVEVDPKIHGSAAKVRAARWKRTMKQVKAEEKKAAKAARKSGASDWDLMMVDQSSRMSGLSRRRRRRR